MSPRPTTVKRTRVAIGRPRWRKLLLVAILALVGYVFFGRDHGPYPLGERWRKLEEVELRAALLEAENDSLRQALWLLENDLDYVEKVAREEYGMSREMERVYRLRPTTPQEENR